MLLTTENANGTASPPELEEDVVKVRPMLRLMELPAPPFVSYTVAEPNGDGPREGEQPVLALFCYEEPDTDVTRFLAQMATGLVGRGVVLHIYARKAFTLDAPGAVIRVLGDGNEGGLLERVQQFTHRAVTAFLRQYQASPAPVTLMGCEWTAVPALSLLRGIKNLGTILSLHSLERQRSDLSSDLSRQIEEIEQNGLRIARMVLTHHEATPGLIHEWAPDFASRVVPARPQFALDDFSGAFDPAAIKARYNVGPVDPMILYVGDLSERYGPDLLLKAMPTVLKKHPQARLVVVGDGSLYWPLRVYSRYLLLDHAIRFPGHVEGAALNELVQAADLIVVPSRDSTPWWPVQAGWAAGRPIVATHEAAPELLEHERDCVLVYPEIPSCAWGIDHVLSNPAVAQSVAIQGARKLRERFGWDAVAAQVLEAMDVPARIE
jgi:glycosyltransferase involved in cell wall biosynthesis